MRKERKAIPKPKKSDLKNQSDSFGIKLGVMNVTPAKLYSQHPCYIGFAYMRLEVSGEARACCIAKHSVGDLNEKSWREIWRSEAYAAFRAKMLRIQKEKFHLKDPEYLFCQQCSHMNTNLLFIRASGGEKNESPR